MAFLHHIPSCQNTAVEAYAEVYGTLVEIIGVVAHPDGSQMFRAEMRGTGEMWRELASVWRRYC